MTLFSNYEINIDWKTLTLPLISGVFSSIGLFLFSLAYYQGVIEIPPISLILATLPFFTMTMLPLIFRRPNQPFIGLFVGTDLAASGDQIARYQESARPYLDEKRCFVIREYDPMRFDLNVVNYRFVRKDDATIFKLSVR